MWPFMKSVINRAIFTAKADQLAHEAQHPEPYDAEQRVQAVTIRAKYLLVSAKVTPPKDLPARVRSIV